MYVYVTRVPSVVRCHVRSYRSRTLITFTASPTDSSCSLQHKMSYEHTQTHTGDEYNSTVVTTNRIVASGSPPSETTFTLCLTLNLTPLWSYLCSSAPANIQHRAQSVDSVTEAVAAKALWAFTGLDSQRDSHGGACATPSPPPTLWVNTTAWRCSLVRPCDTHTPIRKCCPSIKEQMKTKIRFRHSGCPLFRAVRNQTTDLWVNG